MNEEPHVIIWDSIVDRINEALNKKNWNSAYELAFTVGIQVDIENALKPILLKARRDSLEKVRKLKKKLIDNGYCEFPDNPNKSMLVKEFKKLENGLKP